MTARPAPPPPLLRAPPFPRVAPAVAAVSQPAEADARAPILSDAAIDPLFAAIAAERVGGAFWHDADPWRFDDASPIRAAGDDERAAIATIAGRPVEILSAGRYGVPGEDAAARRRRVAAAILGCRYRDPFSGQAATVEQTIALLGLWRRTIDANRGIAAAAGMAWWKRDAIRRFLWSPGPLRFARGPRAVEIAARARGSVAIWPSRIAPDLIAAAAHAGVPLVRVEDGFLRSAGLGSDLHPPASVVVDRRGIHFDPAQPSDLEVLLETADFPPALLDRAARLRDFLVARGVGKYGADTSAVADRPRDGGRRRVLVAGQVEDDMSVKAGGGAVRGNLDLLRRTRAAEPDAEIWFRPHPDVDAGHRRGLVRDRDALAFADRVVRGGGMAPLLAAVDAVHVLTSLTGFEALLRGREVVTHGSPFFAGWGLTRDLGPPLPRRTRRLAPLELIAGVLLLYPRYLDPVTGLPCPAETLAARLAAGEMPPPGLLIRLRQWQGRIGAWLR